MASAINEVQSGKVKMNCDSTTKDHSPISKNDLNETENENSIIKDEINDLLKKQVERLTTENKQFWQLITNMKEEKQNLEKQYHEILIKLQKLGPEKKSTPEENGKSIKEKSSNTDDDEDAKISWIENHYDTIVDVFYDLQDILKKPENEKFPPQEKEMLTRAADSLQKIYEDMELKYLQITKRNIEAEHELPEIPDSIATPTKDEALPSINFYLNDNKRSMDMFSIMSKMSLWPQLPKPINDDDLSKPPSTDVATSYNQLPCQITKSPISQQLNTDQPTKQSMEFSCLECDRSFTTKRGLGVHLARSHGEKHLPTVKPKPMQKQPVSLEFSCPECNRSFTTQRGLSVHRTRSHAGNDIQVVNSQQKVTKLIQEDESLDYPCSTCGRSFTSQKGLSIHFTKMHGSEQVQQPSQQKPLEQEILDYPCSTCGRSFTSQKGLSIHFTKMHGSPQVQASASPKQITIRQPEVCGYNCSACNSSFSSQRGLSIHYTKMHTIKQERSYTPFNETVSYSADYSCWCGRSFSSQRGLSIHMSRSH